MGANRPFIRICCKLADVRLWIGGQRGYHTCNVFRCDR